MESSPESSGELDIYAMSDRIKQLEQEKSILADENKSLKAQFEDSLKELEKIEDIKCENRDLKQNLSNQLANIQDLQRRLDISLKNNYELNRKLEAVQQSNQSSYNFEMQALKRQLNENILNNAKEVENLQTKIEDGLTVQGEMQKQIAIMNSLNAKTISLANVFFETEFPDLLALHYYLSDSRSKLSNKLPQTNDETENQNILNQLKDKINKEKQKYKHLKLDYFNQQQEFQFRLNEKDNQITEIADKLQKSLLENNAQQLEYENKISELKTRKPTRNVSVQVISIPEEITGDMKIDESPIVGVITTPQKDDQSAAIKALKNQNTELLEEIKNLRQQKDKLADKLRKNPQQTQENLEKEINKLNGELDFKNKDIESMKLQLMAARASNDEANTAFIALKNEKDTILESMSTLMDQFEEQKLEIEKLTFARNSLVALLQRFVNVLTNIEHKEEKIQKPVPLILPQKSEEIMIWNFEPLPADLRQILERVASNYSASNNSRLKSVISLTAKYINDFNQQTKTELDELKSSINDFNRKHVQLMSGLTEVLGEDIDESNAVEAILALKDEIDTLNAELLSSNSKIENFLHQAEQNSLEDILANSVKREKQLNNLARQLEDSQNTIDNLKHEIKMLKKAFGKAEQKLVYSIDQLKDSLKDSEHEKNKLREQLTNSRKQCCDLVNEMAELRQQCKDEVDEVRESYDDLLSQIEMSKIDKLNQSNKNLNNANHEKMAAARQIGEKEQQIARLNDELEKQTKRSQNLAEEVEMLTNKVEEQKMIFDEQIVKEREQLTNNYENQINEYKKRSKTDSDLVTKTTEALKNNEQKCQYLLQKVKELERQVSMSEAQRKNSIECAERQRKLFEAQQRSVMINADIKRSEYAYAIKQEYEQKERVLINTFAQNFHRFVDINTTIDANAFQAAVINLKTELERLQTIERSIRSICGANESDKTEDALTFFAIQHQGIAN